MDEIKIGRMVLGSCATNCYFLYKANEKKAVLIDPADRGDFIYEKLSENGFTIEAILLTHGHFDHILGAKKVKERSGAEIYALAEEAPLCENAKDNLSGWSGEAYTLSVDHKVQDGDVLHLAGMDFQVLATPGHTLGSCCYYLEEAKFLLCGDTIFLESVGRTDFPTGSMSKLVRSVQEKIFTLPDDVKLYPGHGDETTVEHEKQYNPFF